MNFFYPLCSQSNEATLFANLSGTGWGEIGDSKMFSRFVLTRRLGRLEKTWDKTTWGSKECKWMVTPTYPDWNLIFSHSSLSEKLLPFVNCVSKGRTRTECMNSLLNHLIERKSRFITPIPTWQFVWCMLVLILIKNKLGIHLDSVVHKCTITWRNFF